MTKVEKNKVLRELERYTYSEHKNGTVLVHFDDVVKTLKKLVDDDLNKPIEDKETITTV